MTTTLRPMSLCAELTYRCPLKCAYCSNPIELSKYSQELDTEDWLRVLHEAAELGIIQMHFSGGEPMLREDLLELIRTARALDLYSDLSTSGFTANADSLAALKEAGLDAIQVSLLDSNAEGNDRIAGTVSFNQKCEAIHIAKSLGFPVSLNIVLHRHNLDHLPELLGMARDWGVERLELAHVQYVGWAFENRNALMPTHDQLERTKRMVAEFATQMRGKMFVLHVLPDYFQARPKACLQGWGNQFMSIAPDGAVLPCQTAREIPGLVFPNVRDESLNDIWFDSEVFNKFRGTDWLPEPCQSCDQKEIDFGGCRCQAFLITGDMSRTDPICERSPDHHLVEQALVEAGASDSDFQYRVLRK